MIDEPLPLAIVETLDRALNPAEAALLLALYRQKGISAAVRKGLWFNKNRSAEGRALWRQDNSPRQARKRAKKQQRRHQAQNQAEAILANAIAAARS